MINNVTDSIKYIEMDDTSIELFENQYKVPDGITYNSYVILDDKIAIMDTADRNFQTEWFADIEKVLGGRTPDYLVVSHVEPDHSGSIQFLLDKYPDITLVGNAKTFPTLNQFYSLSDYKSIVVKEGDTLSLGNHNLKFIMAPMIHWPEVMVSYETEEKILFSADAFGKFGVSKDYLEEWLDEARRYYINIVGKYGAPVSVLLKKAATLDIQKICPLHGPVLSDNLGFYIDKYSTWSSYKPEEEGVLIAVASIHGNTLNAANKFAGILKDKGIKNVSVIDLANGDITEAVSLAFKYDKLVVAAASYDGGVFPCMLNFLNLLSSKAYQNRTVGIIENGSWAPMAAKVMKGMFEKSKNITWLENTVTIKAGFKSENIAQIEAMADELMK